MDKAIILSKIIDEHQKVIDNLKASVERYKTASDMDEDNTLDPDDYARQTEAKDMQLRFEQKLKAAKQKLQFLEDSKKETKEEIEPGTLMETDKNFIFVGVSVPVVKYEGKEIICFSEDAPIYKSIKGKKIGDIFEIGENKFEIKKIN
jgi:hypothetical protein